MKITIGYNKNKLVYEKSIFMIKVILTKRLSIQLGIWEPISLDEVFK